MNTDRKKIIDIIPPAGAARVLVTSGFVGSIGTGMFLTGSALYYTRVIHLSPLQVGLGLSLAGLIGMFTSVLLGRLADRTGPRVILVGLHIFRIFAYIGMALVANFWQFLIAVVLVTSADRSGPPANQALVGRIFEKTERLRTMAYLRAFRNVGLGLGALLAGLAVESDASWAYRLLVFGNAISFIPMAFLVARLKRFERPVPAAQDPVDEPSEPAAARARPLREIPFLSVSLANGFLMLHDSILFVALPLWIVGYTEAPPFMVAVVLIINTMFTAFGQVWWTRMAESLSDATRALTTCGTVLALASAAIGVAHYGNALTASVLIVVGVLLLTAGENLHAAAAWQISYDLSPAGQQTQYLAVFNLGTNVHDTAGPMVITALGVSAGPPGWLGLAAIFLLASTAERYSVGWTSRTRAAAALSGRLHVSEATR
ncbi:MFS transporter [Streptosporangium sp. NPDC049248]|uniref:MFS transporter n=1 Tax=Streptosporangium sp. NPDC049248 TaxID=3155651 RepID=UPI003415544E